MKISNLFFLFLSIDIRRIRISDQIVVPLWKDKSGCRCSSLDEERKVRAAQSTVLPNRKVLVETPATESATERKTTQSSFALSGKR